MIVDMRCPRCNGRVEGREDVQVRTTLPRVSECRHCRARIVLAETPEARRIDPRLREFYFAVVQQPGE